MWKCQLLFQRNFVKSSVSLLYVVCQRTQLLYTFYKRLYTHKTFKCFRDTKPIRYTQTHTIYSGTATSHRTLANVYRARCFCSGIYIRKSLKCVLPHIWYTLHVSFWVEFKFKLFANRFVCIRFVFDIGSGSVIRNDFSFNVFLLLLLVLLNAK